MRENSDRTTEQTIYSKAGIDQIFLELDSLIELPSVSSHYLCIAELSVCFGTATVERLI